MALVMTSGAPAVASDDPRLSDARAPLAHGHVKADVANLQTALDAMPAAMVAQAAIANVSNGGMTLLTDVISTHKRTC